MLNWPIGTDAHMRHPSTKKCRFQSLKNHSKRTLNTKRPPISISHSSFHNPYYSFPISHSLFPIPHLQFPISHFSFPIPVTSSLSRPRTGDVMSSYTRDSLFPIQHSSFPIPHSPIPHSIFSVLVPSRRDWVVIHCLFAIVLFLWHLKMLLLFEKGFSAFLRHAKSIKYWMLYESYVIFAIWFSCNYHITNFITFAGSLWPRMAKRPWDLKEKRHFPKSHYGTTSWKIAVVIFALSCPVWVTAPMNITRVLTTGSCIERWQNHDRSHARSEQFKTLLLLHITIAFPLWVHASYISTVIEIHGLKSIDNSGTRYMKLIFFHCLIN